MQETNCAFTELRSKRSGYQLKQQVTSFQNGELPGDQFFYRQLKVSQLINDVKTIALWIIPGPVWCFGAQYVTR